MVRATLQITVELEADDLTAMGLKAGRIGAACREEGKVTRWTERSLTARQRPKAATTARAQDGDGDDAQAEAAAVNEDAAH